MNPALAAFRTLLAACPGWRELCGIDSGTEEEKQAAAEAAIVPWGENDPDTFPRAYIAQASIGTQRNALGMFTESGTISFRLFVSRDTETTFADSYSDFTASLATIQGEFHTVNASGGYIDLSETSMQIPAPDDAARETKFWVVDGTASYSLGAIS